MKFQVTATKEVSRTQRERETYVQVFSNEHGHFAVDTDERRRSACVVVGPDGTTAAAQAMRLQ